MQISILFKETKTVVLGIFLILFSTTLYASSIGDVVLKEGNSVIQREDKTEIETFLLYVFLPHQIPHIKIFVRGIG